MVKPGAEYYNLEKVAEVLSVSTAEVNRLREKSKLRGFRDGKDWKFLKEEVHTYLAEAIKARSSGGNGQKPGDSDFDLAGGEDSFSNFDSLMEDAALPGDSDLVSLAPAQPKSDLDLAALDHDSDLALAEETAVSSIVTLKKAKTGEEPVNMIVQEEEYEDSSAVLLADKGADKGTDKGEELSSLSFAAGDLDSSALVLAKDEVDSSDAILTPDSEIHEVEFDDDSILEAEGSSPQLGLAGDSGFDILDVGGDSSIMQLDEEHTEAIASPIEVEVDEFDLEPSQILMNDDDSESSSQVIAIDVGLEGEESEGAGAFGGGDDFDFMGVDFDSDVAPPPAAETPVSDPFGEAATEDVPQFDAFAAPAVSVTPAKKAVVPEEEYSTGVLIALASALAVMLLPGIMVIDNMVNIWSWNEPFTLNSVLMGQIANLFGL